MLVKELSEFKLKFKDVDKVNQLVSKWKACVEIAGGVLEDAVETFKVEAQKSLQTGQTLAKIKPLLQAPLLPKKDTKNRKYSFMSQNS